MRVSKIYRIYTQQKNKREIVGLAAAQFESFTIQPTIGYYRGRPEKSIVLEIVGSSEREVSQLALRIKKMNGQKSILITRTHTQARAFRI
jgi:hypothetical protein